MTDDSKDTRLTDLSRKIRIDSVIGGGTRDQQALKRNYFLATGVNDTYQFFDPGNDLIVTQPAVVATGVVFQFELQEMPGVTWTISNFAVVDDNSATGNWTNTQKIDLEDGTFTAQAGGGTGEEETASPAYA